MTFHLDNITKQTNEGDEYLTFALRVSIPEWGEISGKGWRYFPSTGEIAPPAKNSGTKAKPRWTATQWLKGKIWAAAAQEIQDYLIGHAFCGEPFETTEQRRASIKGTKEKKPKTQEQWNTEYFAKKDKEKKK